MKTTVDVLFPLAERAHFDFYAKLPRPINWLAAPFLWLLFGVLWAVVAAFKTVFRA